MPSVRSPNATVCRTFIRCPRYRPILFPPVTMVDFLIVHLANTIRCYLPKESFAGPREKEIADEIRGRDASNASRARSKAFVGFATDRAISPCTSSRSGRCSTVHRGKRTSCRMTHSPPVVVDVGSRVRSRYDDHSNTLINVPADCTRRAARAHP